MKKVILLLLLAIISITILSIPNFISRFHTNIFRLSVTQVNKFLVDTKYSCGKLSECKLLPGDILIRRYITQKTFIIDKLANPYFTHTAFYLGNNKIVEAIGTEKNKEDEIRIIELSKSDWVDTQIESLVVIRPIYSTKQQDAIKSNLEKIADDRDYVFGIPKLGVKQTTCADLILKQLVDEGIVKTSSIPEIITPDYLFFTTAKNQNYFRVGN